ncbi:hypothetical protein D3C72_797530 [compost metagenome]
MDRDEQVGAFLAGDFGTAAQRNEVVAGTGQFGTETFHAVDLALGFTGNLQHHVFLALASGAGSPRIFATVTGVDHHNDVAFAGRGWRQFDCRLRRRDRHGRHRGDRRCRRRRWRGVGGVIEQVDHQSVTVLSVRRQGEAFRRHGLFQVDDHPQVGRRALGRAHGGNRGVRGVDVERRTEGRAIDVDDQAVRSRQGKDAVLHRAGQVKHQSCVVRCPPQTNTVDLRIGHSVDGHRQKQHPYGSNQRAKAHT